ncbi:complement C1s subcomponent-like, partial [Leucoraja erinacea]|uniref:complement C1s subcomponent-like n=1 Tax=Leucoraja erinaceus TaxID=7782 RepID=UPI002456F22A
PPSLTPPPHSLPPSLTWESLGVHVLDVDECTSQWEGRARCHHFCHNYIGGFRCFCRQGYSLHGDGRTCKVTDCGHPGALVNGHYSLVDRAAGTGIGAVVTYRCLDRYYRLAAKSDGLYTCLINGKWSNVVVGEDAPHCDAVCGKTRWPWSGPQRVLGGSRARPGSFPWHVNVEDSVCGGALVSATWVLTSASCVAGLSAVRMLTGGTDRNDPALWQRLEATDIHIHPGYDRSPLAHDLALLRLRGEARFGENVSPVCLPLAHSRYRVETGAMGYVSGFGQTELLAHSDRLMFAPVPVAELAECWEGSLGESSLPLSGEVFCAGGTGTDACTGDGGGSLVFRDTLDSDSVFTAGVVSWGSECGHFGLYTSVQHHLDWITSVMQSPTPGL